MFSIEIIVSKIWVTALPTVSHLTGEVNSMFLLSCSVSFCWQTVSIDEESFK